jgi:putative ABC transport system permease protein
MRTGKWTCERGPADSGRGHYASTARVDPAYFDVMGARVTSGRAFRDTDLESGQRVAIVNQSFANYKFGGADPVGRRLRYANGEGRSLDAPSDEPGPWYDIVGVVPDLGMRGASAGGVYHPARPEAIYPANLAIHIRGDAQTFVTKVGTIAAAVDPGLRLHEVMPVDRLVDGEIAFANLFLGLVSIVSSVALLLSLAAIYAVMSFTVARRTREIGIRVALGGHGRNVLGSVFARPLTQVAFGILAGAVIVTVISTGSAGLTARHVGAVSLYALMMMGVCMLACIVPTLRALRIQPTEALKSE